ncbi:MADS-box transcription factor PHERES 2-like [Punica granatum]|uniref:MADS-box domain-containing protein n=2 Tax=Punica granatum TaxID=22663 RepID=A0A218XJJ1_PUNGR|nr:MADS-box transcription factor PHERES 2-like [Punica granatum]OWM84641.1 hypothetical protein CDL15_Pgr027428 [Punica granatum]PKI69948.1 hypothetical protein CRG98_009823 [Punica granatum]
MGRGKLALEFITKDRSRKTTFEKRKKGLVKKAEEFSILCGVDTCMIIYNPDDSSGRGITIWPQDPERVKQVIDRYLNEGVDRRNRRAMGLTEFYMGRKRKADNELAKIRSANWAAKYPYSEEPLNGLSLDQLQTVLSMLGMKLENAKKRLLAAKESAVMNASGMVPMQMDEFKFNTSVHSHINDYMPLDGIKPLEFQQLMIPYLPPLMDSNMMMNSSMMWSQVGDSSTNTNNSSSILANNHNTNNNYYYNYPLTVPAYNRSFPQSTSFSIHHSGMDAMDKYDQMRGSHQVPENTMFDSSGQGMLGNTSSMMMMMMPPQQQPLMLQYPMMQQGNTNSPPFASPDQGLQFHDNGNSNNQFFPSHGGNH